MFTRLTHLGCGLLLAIGATALAGASDTDTQPAAVMPVKAFTNSIGMTFVLIPAGEFVMGSPPDEVNRFSDEKQHRVKITRHFWMSTTEVTQAQWKAVMGVNPSRFIGDNLPVESVSWTDADKFCRSLKDKDGKTYRLPTEAEWEFACRAGTKTAFVCGDVRGNVMERLKEHAWFADNSDPDDPRPFPVGLKLPNAWGLYDMHGNVKEWCGDWYGEYPSGLVTDPTGLAKGETVRAESIDNGFFALEAQGGAPRVVRGGSFLSRFTPLRSAHRNGVLPGYRHESIGFRVVCVAAAPEPSE